MVGYGFIKKLEISWQQQIRVFLVGLEGLVVSKAWKKFRVKCVSKGYETRDYKKKGYEKGIWF